MLCVCVTGLKLFYSGGTFTFKFHYKIKMWFVIWFVENDSWFEIWFVIWHYDLICDLPITVSYLLFHSLLQYYSFSALTLLVGRQEEHPACRNRLIRCWCGYLSAARCRLFCIWNSWWHCIPRLHHLLPPLNPGWFYLSGTGFPGCPGKEAVERM